MLLSIVANSLSNKKNSDGFTLSFLVDINLHKAMDMNIEADEYEMYRIGQNFEEMLFDEYNIML